MMRLRQGSYRIFWQQWMIFRNERKFDEVYNLKDEGLGCKLLELDKNK